MTKFNKDNRSAAIAVGGIETDVWKTEDNRFTLTFVEVEPDTFVYVLHDADIDLYQQFVAFSAAAAYVRKNA